MTEVAYLRKEKQTVEIDYPLSEVWAAIPETLKTLEWSVEQVDDTAHHMQVKTKAGFISYGSNLTIEGLIVDEKKCRITVHGETPVTTITSLADFGRTSNRLDLFFETLARQMYKAAKS